MATKKKTTKSKATAKRRRTTAAKATRKARAPKASAPKSGTTLRRRFKGADHVVNATGDGFEYAGTTYRSLTQVAKIITGYASISGPRFFGTDQAAKAKGGAK